MELDGWDVCEEDIFNDEKNTGRDEMTMDNVGSSQGVREKVFRAFCVV